jgi:hypothetical protein
VGGKQQGGGGETHGRGGVLWLGESSLVRLREGEEREGRRREVGRELSGAFERRRRVRREKTGKQQSTHGAGTAAV